MDTITKIQAAVNALNDVSVSGYGNLDRLLGSIQILLQVIKDLEKSKSAEEAPNKT